MSIFKIEKDRNYTVMSNYHLRDKNLGYKAKGLLSFMLSLPEDWDYSLNGLCSISKESRDGIRSILKELQENHYLEIEKVRGAKGYFEYNYLIYEKPHFIELDNPDMETPHLDKPDVETPTQINTNKINTNNKDDKIDKTKITKHYDCSDLTQELIELGYIDFNSNKLSLYDELFDDLLNKYSFTDLTIKTRYIISNIKGRDFKDEYNNLIRDKFIYFKTALLSNISKIENIPDNLWTDDDLINLYEDVER